MSESNENPEPVFALTDVEAEARLIDETLALVCQAEMDEEFEISWLHASLGFSLLRSLYEWLLENHADHPHCLWGPAKAEQTLRKMAADIVDQMRAEASS